MKHVCTKLSNWQIWLCALFMFFCYCSLNAQNKSWITDVTHEVGLDIAIGSRVILADINNDNYPDLMTGSGNVNRNTYKIYLNVPNPDLSSPFKRIFIDWTDSSNMSYNRNPDTTGRVIDIASLVDVNNDGNLDLVTSIYYHRLQMYADDPGDRSEVMLGDGKGHFTLKKDNGLYQYGLINSTGLAWLDYDLDGKLDLYIATWFYDYANEIKQPDVLFKGSGDGAFTKISNSGIEKVSEPIYGVNVTDWDNDGWPDVITSGYCRSGGSLFRNMHNGTYSDMANAANYSSQLMQGDNGQNLCQWDANPADFDNDGDMDILHANVHGGYDKNEGRSHLSVNQGVDNGFSYKWEIERIRRDAPAATHVSDQGSCWMDLNGDGLQDVVFGQSGYPAANTLGQEHLYIILQNDTNYFDDASAALGIKTTMKEAHSPAPADFDLDGDQDLFFTRQMRDTTWADSVNTHGDTVKYAASINNYMRMFVLQNNIGNSNNWVAVKLDAPDDCNKSAIGARIYVYSGSKTQIQEIQTGLGHFAKQQPFIRNVGLGQDNYIDSIVVRWPMQGIPTTTVKNPPLNLNLTINKDGLQDHLKPWDNDQAAIAFIPGHLVFDRVNINEESDAMFFIKNIDNAPLIISDMSEIDPDNVFEYSLPSGVSLPVTLTTDQSLAISVKFSPLYRKNFSGQIVVNSNAKNGTTRKFDLNGFGFEAKPMLELVENYIDFDTIWTNVVNTKQFTIKNTGELPLSISKISFDPSIPEFYVDEENCSFEVESFSSKTFNVHFKPSKVYDYKSAFVIHSNAYNTPVDSVYLHGLCNGPAPEIKLSTTVMLFGNVTINTNKDKQLTLTNTGNDDLVVSHLEFFLGDESLYSVIPNTTMPFSILKDSSWAITIRFAPTSIGLQTDSLYITSNAYSKPMAIAALRGSGIESSSVEDGTITRKGNFAFVLAPNPVKDECRLIIITDEKLFEKANISIIDMLGRVVWQQNPSNSSANNNEIQFNTSGMATGYYHLRVNIDSEVYDLPLIKE